MGIDFKDILKGSVLTPSEVTKDKHVTFSEPIINDNDDGKVEVKNRHDNFNNNNNIKSDTEESENEHNSCQTHEKYDSTLTTELFNQSDHELPSTWSNNAKLICKELLGEEEYTRRENTQFHVSTIYKHGR